MIVTVPKKESVARGRLVRCHSCFKLNPLGAMITVEYTSECNIVTKQVCSIDCLSKLIKEVGF